MTMRKPFLNGLALCCFTLAAAGCANEKEPAAATAELKAKAAQALVAGERHGDPCADHGWYADGECDSFCANADSDCEDGEEAVGCTLLLELPNGVCARAESDPCRFQDPDCSPGATDPVAPVAPGGVAPGGVVCATFIEVSDNVCSRPANDPCRSQDPDCAEGGGTNPGCPPILLPSDGVCSPHPSNGTCGVQDPDCVPGGGGEPSCEPVACTLIEEASDGVCSRPIDDPCKSQDPDCSTEPAVCALFIEAPDGQCSRFTNDPCIGQDPDCRPARR